MHPTAASHSPGWLLSDVVAFDALTDGADRVIARLATQARAGDAGAIDRITDIRRRVSDLDGLDAAAVESFAAVLASVDGQLDS